MSKYYQIIVLIVLFSISSHAQYDLLRFEPIDSISITSRSIKLYDVNNDDADDIFISTDNGIYIYDGSTRDILWADTSIGAMNAIEMGDIESDGLIDYFAGTNSSEVPISIYTYFGNNPDGYLEWPGYLIYPISYIHFFRRDDIPYLDFISAAFGYQINLSNWDYEAKYIGYPCANFYIYDDTCIGWDYLSNLEGYGNLYIFFYDLDFNLLSDRTLLHCDYDSNVNFEHAFGNYDSTDYDIIYSAYCLYASNHLILHKSDTEFYSYSTAEFPQYTSSSCFKALNVTGDFHDELIISTIHEGQNKMVLFNGDMEVLAHSSPIEPISILAAGDIDGDGYDEVIFSRNNYLICEKLKIEQTDIDEKINLPQSFSATVYPNPFNAHTNINLYCNFAGKLDIEVFDVLGRKVANIFEGDVSEGEHSFNWSPYENYISTGVYFLTVKFNNEINVRKMVTSVRCFSLIFIFLFGIVSEKYFPI